LWSLLIKQLLDIRALYPLQRFNVLLYIHLVNTKAVKELVNLALLWTCSLGNRDLIEKRFAGAGCAKRAIRILISAKVQYGKALALWYSALVE